jgi:hypothetical protein
VNLLLQEKPLKDDRVVFNDMAVGPMMVALGHKMENGTSVGLILPACNSC